MFGHPLGPRCVPEVVWLKPICEGGHSPSVDTFSSGDFDLPMGITQRMMQMKVLGGTHTQATLPKLGSCFITQLEVKGVTDWSFISEDHLSITEGWRSALTAQGRMEWDQEGEPTARP